MGRDQGGQYGKTLDFTEESSSLPGEIIGYIYMEPNIPVIISLKGQSQNKNTQYKWLSQNKKSQAD